MADTAGQIATLVQKSASRANRWSLRFSDGREVEYPVVKFELTPELAVGPPGLPRTTEALLPASSRLQRPGGNMPTIVRLASKRSLARKGHSRTASFVRDDFTDL